jgi:hypothetical protein
LAGSLSEALAGIGEALMDLPIASQLEARRVELGWTIRRLAAQAGYPETTTGNVLLGRNVRINTFRDHAQALGFAVSLVPME